MYNILLSVMSYRELQDEQQRLHFLHMTLWAQIKLADELSPRELDKHADSPDPVAAALAARRKALQNVRDSFYGLLKHHAHTKPSLENMGGYYAILESMLKYKDRDMKKFQEVVEGEGSAWCAVVVPDSPCLDRTAGTGM